MLGAFQPEEEISDEEWMRRRTNDMCAEYAVLNLFLLHVPGDGVKRSKLSIESAFTFNPRL